MDARVANDGQLPASRGVFPRLSVVLDVDHRVNDVHVSALERSPPRFDAWLDERFVERFVDEDRARVDAALHDAAAGRPGSTLATISIGGVTHDVAVRIESGSRLLFVVVEPVVTDPMAPVAVGPESDPLRNLGLVASRVSHDFKNLLSAILINADLLEREQWEPEAVREVAAEIVLATDRARELIDQILGHAVGGDPRVHRSIDVNALTHEMGRLLDVSTPPTVVMRYELAPSIPSVLGRASRIRQLVMNIIVNAADAIGDEVGAIVLRTRVVAADDGMLGQTRTRQVPAPGRYVCIEIEDTGPGLEPTVAREIFEPFFSTKKHGHGLGLSDSLAIVEEHGGALLLDSALGHGTTFRVLLPIAMRETGETPRIAEPGVPRSFAGHTILVIDDDELVRSVLRRALEGRGFAVITARDGFEGVEVFTEHHAALDCVLLDMGMPYFKGSDVFDEMVRVDPAVPVLFVSGHGEQELREHEAVGRAAGVLIKPFRDGQLIERIEAALQAGPGATSEQ